MNAIFLCLLTTCIVSGASLSQKPGEVRFKTADGGSIVAHLYKNGGHAVILAHGAIFDKESWQPLAEHLAKNGLTVLAIDFRGYGKSTAGKQKNALHLDILGALAYLKENGVHTVSVLGASMGGGAAARASVNAQKGDIHKLILLSPVPIQHPEELKADEIIYLGSKDEALAARIKTQFQKAPEPKRLKLLSGSAHAQHIFKTAQAEELTALITKFLLENGKTK